MSLQFICVYLDVESEPNNWKTMTMYHMPRSEMGSGTIAYPLDTYNLDDKCRKCMCKSSIIWDILWNANLLCCGLFLFALAFSSFPPDCMSMWNLVVSQYKTLLCVVIVVPSSFKLRFFNTDLASRFIHNTMWAVQEQTWTVVVSYASLKRMWFTG